MKTYDIVIIGGGPAGLSAAVAARKNGTESILILERDKELGGILNQCIHNGFGLHTFQEELTGSEYAGRFITQVIELGIKYKLHTMVMDIRKKQCRKLPGMACLFSPAVPVPEKQRQSMRSSDILRAKVQRSGWRLQPEGQRSV